MDNHAPTPWNHAAFAFLKPAKDVWTREEYLTLTRYLLNDNDHLRYAFAWRKPDGTVKYSRAKTMPSNKRIAWNAGTVFGQSRKKTNIAFYSKNIHNESRWGVLDFDAHDGNWSRAEDLAMKALRLAQQIPEVTLILEHSGRGFHLWVIYAEFKEINFWVRLLKHLARDSKATLDEGICEIFPPDSPNSDFGKPVRAPGSYNFFTETLGLIIYENCGRLIDDLMDAKSLCRLPAGDKFFSSYRASEIADEIFRKVLNRFAIRYEQTRNDKMIGLVTQAFYKFSESITMRLVEEQFLTKAVETNGSLQETLACAKEHWENMERTWVATLSAEEFTLFENLNPIRKAAFRIIRGWARYAPQKGASDFHIVQAHLAKCLGVTRQAVGEMIVVFQERAILRPVQEYIPQQRARRYVWLLKEPVTVSLCNKLQHRTCVSAHENDISQNATE